MIPNTAPVSVQPASTAVATAATKKHTGFELSFDNLLDIVNPLQHLPVIGTLYRAITGDKIAAPEKIAGGALFGGLWGLVSSVADAAFEAVTGKDFGSTVLALFTGHHESKTIAANINAVTSVAAPEPATDVGALMAALATKGVDSDTARRATYAYSKTINMAAADALR